MQFKENWRLYQNYIIIGVLSLISVFFLPMLGTGVDIGFNVPNTTAGWIVWILTKLCIVAINIILLDQFIKQAKVNIRDNENFIEANEYYYSRTEEEEYLPAPKEYIGSLYKRKGISMTVTSALSVFGLTSAILSFDWVSMLTYLFTIVFGLIFGWMTMNNVEEYWTDTYYRRYKRDKAQEDMELAEKERIEAEKQAERERIEAEEQLKREREEAEEQLKKELELAEEQAKRDLELAEEEHIKQADDSTSSDSGSNILDTSMDSGNTGNNNIEMVLDYSWNDLCFLGRPIYTSCSSTNSTNSVRKENI